MYAMLLPDTAAHKFFRSPKTLTHYLGFNATTIPEIDGGIIIIYFSCSQKDEKLGFFVVAFRSRVHVQCWLEHFAFFYHSELDLCACVCGNACLHIRMCTDIVVDLAARAILFSLKA